MTQLERAANTSQHLITTTLTHLPNPNALVAVSNGMRAVKLCTNSILQFLTGGAG